MTELTRSELRTVQLDILQAVDAFCCEKGLRYSIACGTLLGAVRDKHSGEVVGFYICDTGAAQKQPYTYISVDQLNKCCKGVRNACVQMTAKSYGEVKL